MSLPSIGLGLVVLAGPESVDALMARIPSVATGAGGVSKEGQQLAARLQALAPESIPRLLLELKRGTPETREFVGYVLSDIKGLREEHVDTLLAAMRAGNGWIAPAVVHT